MKDWENFKDNSLWQSMLLFRLPISGESNGISCIRNMLWCLKLRKARELISIYHTHSSSSILTASIRKNKKMEIICLALSWKTCSWQTAEASRDISDCEIIHAVVSLWSRLVGKLAWYVLPASSTLSRGPQELVCTCCLKNDCHPEEASLENL
jgi:hypothetical protein